MKEFKASIVIANFNGRALLEKNLPSVIKAVEADGENHEIIVVDDGSADGSVEFMQTVFPDIKIVCLEKQQGAIFVHNIGARESSNEIVVYLDNDVEVKEDFLGPLIGHFKDERIFAVHTQMLPYTDRTLKVGTKMGARFSWGLIWDHLDVDEGRIDLMTQAFCVSTGGSAYSRGKLLKLGGFDELFRPLYWDDADICYRAWKRGWILIYEPKAIVYHRYGSTIGELFASNEREYFHRRNRFLFIWKNITDKRFLFQHLFFLPFFLVIAPLKGRPYFTISFFSALKRLKECIKKRKQARESAQLSDREVFKLLSEPDYFRRLYSKRI